ncbi:MAG: hypothetical protein KDA92_02295 [Planctomycetales bacterium]|nr:hypothetical protein [Planctomycetales bacterium]MCA9169554.1 hypothetical protein [Planctomycetales bacterium]
MGKHEFAWVRSLAVSSLSARACVLLVWFVLYGVLAAAAGHLMAGAAGVRAAMLAGAICLFVGLVSLVVTTLVAPPEKAAAHVLLGMTIRMVPPLLICMWVVQQQRGALLEAGFPLFLVAAFLWGLGFETLLSVGSLLKEPS